MGSGGDGRVVDVVVVDVPVVEEDDVVVVDARVVVVVVDVPVVVEDDVVVVDARVVVVVEFVVLVVAGAWV